MDFGRKAFYLKNVSRVGIFGLFVPSTYTLFSLFLRHNIFHFCKAQRLFKQAIICLYFLPLASHSKQAAI